MRKSLIALVCGTLLGVGALPALAQTGVSASLGGVASGQVIQGTVTLTGSATASTGIESITITVNNVQLKRENFGGLQQSRSTSVGWNTTGYNNGDYTLKVTAVGNGGGSGTDSKRVLVDNPPSTPTGLYSSYGDGVVTVGWNRNPESDVYAYRVTRNGTFLIETSATSITDQPGAGDHTYTVTAVRRSPTSGNGKTGGTSSTGINVPSAPQGSTGDTGSGTAGDGTGTAGGSGSGSGGGGNGGAGSGRNSGGSNSGNGKKGGTGPGGAPAGYGSFFTGGRNLSGIGLPSNLTLPGGRLDGYAPSEGSSEADGTFEETLPYDLSGGEPSAELLGETAPNVAARRTSFLIPPDGLRWVAAGLWFLVAAALLKFLERIVATREAAEAASEQQDEDVEAITPRVRFRRNTAA